METSPAGDHQGFSDTAACRRYFAKFERIIAHLRDVFEVAPDRSPVESHEIDVAEGYLHCLANTFTALATKYLLTGIVSNRLPSALEIDRSESGFPVYRELLQLANDLPQIDKHLESLPDRQTLKASMVDHVLQHRAFPRDLQFAMSQRIYYETLRDKTLFLAQNDPQIVWLDPQPVVPRRYLITWAVYDSQTNRPALYLLLAEDSGDRPLGTDAGRWPRVQSHLLAQSLTSLKLLTIAQGFDKDFDDIHPKRLRRVLLGPMYSHTFTKQRGPLAEILAEAGGEPGLDWILGWTVETLQSQRSERKPSGLFGETVTEIFDLDHYDEAAVASGASKIEQSIILPQPPYQVLLDRNDPSLRGLRKFVVGPEGTVLTGA